MFNFHTSKSNSRLNLTISNKYSEFHLQISIQNKTCQTKANHKKRNHISENLKCKVELVWVPRSFDGSGVEFLQIVLYYYNLKRFIQKKGTVIKRLLCRRISSD